MKQTGSDPQNHKRGTEPRMTTVKRFNPPEGDPQSPERVFEPLSDAMEEFGEMMESTMMLWIMDTATSIPWKAKSPPMRVDRCVDFSVR
jgi:hypothetical protein